MGEGRANGRADAPIRTTPHRGREAMKPRVAGPPEPEVRMPNETIWRWKRHGTSHAELSWGGAGKPTPPRLAE